MIPLGTVKKADIAQIKGVLSEKSSLASHTEAFNQVLNLYPQKINAIVTEKDNQ